MKDFIHIMLQYIPFWAVPSMMIGAEFAYIFWLKAFRSLALMLAMFSFINFLFICFYYWAGGPLKSIDKFYQIIGF